MNQLPRLVAAACVTLGLGAAAGPLDALRARDRQIREILRNTPPADRASDGRLKAAVNGIFDYETHTRRSFGRYWDQMSERDRAEALPCVSLLLERSSMDKVHQYQSEKVQFVSETIDPADPSSATALTRVARGRETWEIGYAMRLAAGQWKIVDIAVEGASSVENNRAAFYKEIRQSGMPGLLEKLRKKAMQRRAP